MMIRISGFLYDATGTYNISFHVAGMPLIVGAAILFFIPWAQRTADKTNLMSAAHTYAPDEVTDRESLATELAGSIAATERTMTPIPEIVLAVEPSFVTIDLDDGESYTVPRRIKRRKRESMCSDMSSVSEIVTDTVDELVRQGVSYSKLDTESYAGSHAASLATSPRSRQFEGASHLSTPQVSGCRFCVNDYFKIDNCQFWMTF